MRFGAFWSLLLVCCVGEVECIVEGAEFFVGVFQFLVIEMAVFVPRVEKGCWRGARLWLCWLEMRARFGGVRVKGYANRRGLARCFFSSFRRFVSVVV